MAETYIELGGNRWTFDDSRRLGARGGFGTVYVGRGSDGREFAIKILHGAGDESPRELEFAKTRIERTTPHVIPILDCGIDRATAHPCMVMEKAEKTLRELINERGAMDSPDAAAILHQILLGLLEAEDWVHRDLKPQNILLLNDRWQIADFGIARQAEATTSAHTLMAFLSPAYAAPEQWNAVRAEHSTDIYSVGCIGFELLAGKQPFPGPRREDYADQHRNHSTTLTAGAPLLRSLVLDMLAKQMRSRPSPQQVLQRLDALHAPRASAGAGAQLLQRVSTQISEEQARAEAEAAQVAAIKAERHAVAEHGVRALRGIAAELFERVRANAPQTKVQHRTDGFVASYEATLGHGILTMACAQFPYIAIPQFAQARIDVVAGSILMVRTSQYRRSASLWYLRVGPELFEWHEAAYWPLGSQGTDYPCFLQPQEAANAHGPALHTWQLAHPLQSIEGANLDGFCERWLTFFAMAAAGMLSRPNTLPERY